MNLFEKDGEILKTVPAGGQGGGITSYATVKATDMEAAAFRAAQVPADAPAPLVVSEGAELKQGGPTIQEWVAGGYKASVYPPSGYASKSSAEDVAKAVEAEVLAKIDADKLKAQADGLHG